MGTALAIGATIPGLCPSPALQRVALILTWPFLLALSLLDLAGWLHYRTIVQFRRLMAGSDAVLWIEFFSASLLIAMAVWFLTEPRLQLSQNAFRRLMPIHIWAAWTAFIGIVQGLTTASPRWHVRAQGDAFAGFYWASMFLSLVLRGALSALTPVSFVMATFLGLVLYHYYWESTDRGSQAT